MESSFFRDLVARSRDAIVTMDTDRRVLFANDGVERTLGHDPDELEGRPLTELMPERFREPHREAIERYVVAGERQLDWNGLEFPALHADGHEVPLSIALEEHECDGERVFSAIMRDISHRIEREERLQRKNEQLERFAAIVSHDLRDPLNTAQATLTLLEARAEEGEELEGRSSDYIEDLDTALTRMELLIETVLTLTKSGHAVGDTSPVDLEIASRRAWDLAGDDDATLALATEGLTIEADEERLRALLENLFRNAVEHGSTDGSPSDGRGERAGGLATVRVEVGALREGTTDEPTGFYVADDGPGIPVDERKAVFERGHTSTEDGTGIGLNIVRTIAEAHDWSVTLTESEQGGARFEFDVTGE